MSSPAASAEYPSPADHTTVQNQETTMRQSTTTQPATGSEKVVHRPHPGMSSISTSRDSKEKCLSSSVPHHLHTTTAVSSAPPLMPADNATRDSLETPSSSSRNDSNFPEKNESGLFSPMQASPMPVHLADSVQKESPLAISHEGHLDSVSLLAENSKNAASAANSATDTLLQDSHAHSPQSGDPPAQSPPDTSNIVSDEEDPQTPPAVTPLPYSHLIVVFIMFVTDVLALTSLTPYLPFLCESFNLVSDRTKLGYIAGFIASSYYFAQLFSSIFWGWVSDRVGRRPVMLVGLTSSCLCTLAFGFSKTLPWAIACRLIYGTMNGTLGVMKTSLGEVTDKTNQGKAFSLIGLSFGMGQICGPLISGFTAMPVSTYPALFASSSPLYVLKPFFNYFPFFLPNFIIFSVTLCGLIVGFFFLPESNKAVLAKKRKRQRQKRREKRQQQRSRSRSNSAVTDRSDMLPRIESKSTSLSAESDLLAESSNIEEAVSPIDVNAATIDTSPIRPVQERSFLSRLRQSEILSTAAPLTTSLVYACLGFNSVLFAESVPLWAVLPPSRWGLSFDSKDLGTTMTICGIFILLFNLFILHKIIHKITILGAFRLGAILGFPFLILYPEVSLFFFPRPIMFLVWTSLLILLLIRHTTAQLQFTSVMIMINNSVTFRSAGLLNGISQSAVAFARAFSPVVGGSVFAMSTNNSVFPFDVHLVFVWMALNNLITLALSYLLPKSICEPKIVDPLMETNLDDEVSSDEEESDLEMEEVEAK